MHTRVTAREIGSVARALKPVFSMGARNLSVRGESGAPDLRVRTIGLFVHPCQACGEPTTRAVLCGECDDKSRPHMPDDPYDVLGGEAGTE